LSPDEFFHPPFPVFRHKTEQRFVKRRREIVGVLDCGYVNHGRNSICSWVLFRRLESNGFSFLKGEDTLRCFIEKRALSQVKSFDDRFFDGLKNGGERVLAPKPELRSQLKVCKR
jgi:hypothetical protein